MGITKGNTLNSQPNGVLNKRMRLLDEAIDARYGHLDRVWRNVARTSAWHAVVVKHASVAAALAVAEESVLCQK